MKSMYPILAGAALILVSLVFVMRSGRRVPVADVPDRQATPIPTEYSAPTSQPSAAVHRGITLTVTSPANRATVTSPQLTVRGMTVAGAEVFVNDVETKADGNGNFSVTVTLDEGENYLLVVSNDDIGNYSESELFVTYEP